MRWDGMWCPSCRRERRPLGTLNVEEMKIFTKTFKSLDRHHSSVDSPYQPADVLTTQR